ncbi:MAG: D-tyrosyl-tRNA(Tyr) deacylase [Deltaproteobacteria bacterium]|nr:D-tyrosyl-tRNA(Tyr) deacylase [Deltaproteobacteria bacterium]
MRSVIQRVSRARVLVDGTEMASIGRGLCVLLAAGEGDGEAEADWMADKIVHLRIFPDESGRMNRSCVEIGAGMIAVSQFTLYGDCRRGRRPSFVHALEPERAAALVDRFVERVRGLGVPCGSGVFGAHMEVELVNDGPVTLLLDSAQSRRSVSGGFG